MPKSKERDPTGLELSRADLDAVLGEVIRYGQPLPERHGANDVVGAVLCVLSQRLTGGASRKMLPGVPSRLRDRLEPCIQHRTETATVFDLDGFLMRVAAHLGVGMDDAERLSRVVFAAIQSHVKPEDRRDIAAQLPGDLQRIWEDPKTGTGIWREAPVTGRTTASGSNRPPVLDENARVLREIAQRVQMPEGIGANRVVPAVLCVLAQRLDMGTARKMVGAFPAELRTGLQTCALHRGERAVFDSDGFVHRLATHLGTDEIEAERLARGVFDVIRTHMDPGAVRAVSSQLPKDLDDLWNPA